MSERANPILVEVTRGGRVESVHRGRVAVVDSQGAAIFEVGDVEATIFPRSAVKPLQALVLVESGAAEAYGLGEQQLALACASHEGEPRHVQLVGEWISHLGLSPSALECGAHWPYHAASQRQLAAIAAEPTTLHNNCSGKHAGFLTTALHLGVDHVGYVAEDHPVQRLVRDMLAEMCGVEGEDLPYGVDGCAIPTYALPLSALALGMARLAQPDALAPARRAAARRVVEAMTREPFLVAGSDRYCTRLMSAGRGAAVVKSGAEGVYTGALPGTGVGIAIKCDDGAGRAAEVMMTAVLRRLGTFDHAVARRAPELDRVAVRNRRGVEVGELRAVGALA